MSISVALVCQRLRLAREYADRSRRYVAGKLGISSKRLCIIENGGGGLTLELFTEMCRILEVSEMEILTGIAERGGSEYQLTFEEIASNCSADTVKVMLNVCKQIARVEQKAKGRQTLSNDQSTACR